MTLDELFLLSRHDDVFDIVVDRKRQRRKNMSDETAQEIIALAHKVLDELVVEKIDRLSTMTIDVESAKDLLKELYDCKVREIHSHFIERPEIAQKHIGELGLGCNLILKALNDYEPVTFTKSDVDVALETLESLMPLKEEMMIGDYVDIGMAFHKAIQALRDRSRTMGCECEKEETF